MITKEQLEEIERLRNEAITRGDVYSRTRYSDEVLAIEPSLLTAARRLLELEKVAEGLESALIGCRDRLRVVLADSIGDTMPDFATPPPSALNNIRNVAAALNAYTKYQNEK